MKTAQKNDRFGKFNRLLVFLWYVGSGRRKGDMKIKLVPIFLSALVLTVPFVRGANLITFDDIPTGTNSTGHVVLAWVPSSYAGLNWNNFLAMSGIADFNRYGPSGYYFGVVSPSNIVLNSDGAWARLTQRGQILLSSARI